MREEVENAQVLLEMKWGPQGCEVKELRGNVDNWLGDLMKKKWSEGELSEVWLVCLWVLLSLSV